MLASLYRRVIDLHPPAFREKFGDEMSSIFQQTKGTPAEIGLLVDAVVSLARQWGLRSEFWRAADPAPVPPAPDGVPCFSSLDPFRPRSAAVIQGLLLSIAIFCLTCFAIRYSWIHVLHVRIPEVQFERPTWRPENPPASAAFENSALPIPQPKAASTLPVATTPTIEVPPHLVSGRSKSPKRAIPALADAKHSNSGQIGRLSNESFRGTAEIPLALESLEGTYVVDNPRKLTLVVTVEDGNLTMSIEGQPRLALVPASSTKFTVSAVADCWIDFVPSTDLSKDTSVRQLKFSCNGEEFVARKQ